MDNLIKADIFFFISSIATILVVILVLIAFYYLIRILKNFSDISTILKNGTEKASGHLDTLVEVFTNSILKFFGKKSPNRRRAGEAEQVRKNSKKE